MIKVGRETQQVKEKARTRENPKATERMENPKEKEKIRESCTKVLEKIRTARMQATSVENATGAGGSGIKKPSAGLSRPTTAGKRTLNSTSLHLQQERKDRPTSENS